MFVVFSCGIVSTPLSHSCTCLHWAVIKWIPESYKHEIVLISNLDKERVGKEGGDGNSLRLS